jgi:hypothetical protein
MQEFELSGEQKTIRNLKIATAALTAIAGVAKLVPTPITEGIAIAAGLGSILCGFGAAYLEADNFESKQPVAAVAAR